MSNAVWNGIYNVRLDGVPAFCSISRKFSHLSKEKGDGSILYKAVLFLYSIYEKKRASETFFSNETTQPEVNGEDKLLEAVQNFLFQVALWKERVKVRHKAKRGELQSVTD